MSAGVMKGRSCLVTGGNAGIGRETSLGLAKAGASVIIACRDIEKGDAVRAGIVASVPGADVRVMPLDLASFANIHAFVRAFRAEYDHLDVLINNAGLHTAERTLTEDGHERTWQVNHLGHFLLTNLLLDRLEQGAPARVVTVASEAHKAGTIRFRDLETENWSGIRAYSQSKLANIMFAFALARRIDPSKVTSNAVHPGSVRTGWARSEDSGLLRLVVRIADPFLISPEKGARTTLRVATDPELERVTGAYFKREHRTRSNRESRNVARQERLWEASLEAVGL